MDSNGPQPCAKCSDSLLETLSQDAQAQARAYFYGMRLPGSHGNIRSVLHYSLQVRNSSRSESRFADSLPH